jgi:hypothetical protein
MAERILTDEEMAFGLIEGKEYTLHRHKEGKVNYLGKFIEYDRDPKSNRPNAVFEKDEMPTMDITTGQFNWLYYLTTEE